MFPFNSAMHATGSVGSVVPPGSFIGSYDSHCISFFLPDITNNDLFFVYLLSFLILLLIDIISYLFIILPSG